MGKKARKEREERRDSFAAKRIKQKRKNSLIMGAVLAAVLVIIGISSYKSLVVAYFIRAHLKMLERLEMSMSMHPY